MNAIVFHENTISMAMLSWVVYFLLIIEIQ